MIWIVVVKNWTAGWDGENQSCSVDVHPFGDEAQATEFARTFNTRGGWVEIEITPKFVIGG